MAPRRSIRSLSSLTTLSSPPSLTPSSSTTTATTEKEELKQLRLQVGILQKKVSFYEGQINKPRSTSLQTILLNLHRKHPSVLARRIISLVQNIQPHDALLVRISKFCISGCVGCVGQRRYLRAVAILILDYVIKTIGSAEAKCVKGELLTTCGQDGYNDPFTPRSVLQEGYSLFLNNESDSTAMYLQGKWLITYESLHRNKQKLYEGKNLILKAVAMKNAKALTYLAQCLDSPPPLSITSLNEVGKDYDEYDGNEFNLFCKDCPRNKQERERYVVQLYSHAAKQGDPNAYNDIGACIVSGYGNLKPDFDAAVLFYKIAIDKGCILAYENIATHYETGMAGKFPGRIDKTQALYYYREGVKKRCPKCSYNLAVAYEEGMSDTLTKDLDTAEKYYAYTLRLCDDSNDIQTTIKTIKDLSALYITQLKLDVPGGIKGKRCLKRLGFLAGNAVVVRIGIRKVERSMINGLTKLNRIGVSEDDIPLDLIKVVGEGNAKLLMERALEVDERVREIGSELDFAVYQHVLGIPCPQAKPRNGYGNGNGSGSGSGSGNGNGNGNGKRKSLTTVARKRTNIGNGTGNRSGRSSSSTLTKQAKSRKRRKTVG